MDINQIPTAVKWIVSVLIAGFIAQFGKMFAEYLIRRYREKKERRDAVSGGGNPRAADHVPVAIEDGRPAVQSDGVILGAKARKKLRKAEAKARKRGSK